MKKLKENLLENAMPLEQAAEAVCTDKAFVYDAVYSAVVKTKQKYKKLVNKDRAVDICISLMKQPRKHVKLNFTSVEDCIEKALAAKTVPWRPIVSIVAVVLAAAIILPFCLQKAPISIDPKGFVMEGTRVLVNQTEGNDIVLQNFHELTALGIADPLHHKDGKQLEELRERDERRNDADERIVDTDVLQNLCQIRLDDKEADKVFKRAFHHVCNA